MPAIVGKEWGLRTALAKHFVETTILRQYRELVQWQSVTGQTAQIDSGYLGQHLVSLLTGTPGIGVGGRGKGFDLEDGSEVKVASALGGVDIPRWNNQLSDNEAVRRYLSRPRIFFVLLDTLQRENPFPIRVRVWCVRPRKDAAFSGLVSRWAGHASSRNFQLHPPCWTSSNVTTNNDGNLGLPLIFHAQQLEIGDVDFMEILHANERSKASIATQRGLPGTPRRRS